MKKLISVLKLILFLPIIVYSQWTKIDIGTTNTFLDIEFVTEEMGYISGDHGKIYKTTNSGKEWIEINTGYDDWLNSISFANNVTGLAIGTNSGIVLRTDNSGNSWNLLASDIGVDLLDVYLHSANIGWIVGLNGKIWKTINGGNNWVELNPPIRDYYTVTFINENIGFVGGKGIILKTINGGNNWTTSYITEGQEKPENFIDIVFVDENIGWAVGRDWETGKAIIFNTENGGISWNKQTIGALDLTLQSVYFLNENIGWASGDQGAILSTIDGGKIWEVDNSGTSNRLRDIFAIDTTKVFTVGDNGNLLIKKEENIFSGNVTLNTQEKVVEFGTEGFTIIAGKLDITGDDVNDLRPLLNLSTVEGDLWVTYTSSLTNLDGLSSITSVGGGIRLRNNKALTNLEGLSGLKIVVNELMVDNNKALTNLDALSGLNSIGGDLSVSSNAVLATLNGLNGITFIGGGLYVSNSAFTNFIGLSNLTAIGGNLFVYNNQSLTNLDGLTDLISIGGLKIGDNSILTNLDALSGLTSFVGDISIYNNATLTSINGLEGATFAVEDIFVKNNPFLRNLYALSGIIYVGGDIHIADGNIRLTHLNGLSNITSVGGDITIERTSLTNLDGLSGLTSIGGGLSVEMNGGLTNLEGLNGLTSVVGDLRIDNNPKVTDLNGLSNITSVGGDLFVNNTALANLDGLSGLTFVGGDLSVKSNPYITDLNGLSKINYVGGGFYIVSNSVLANIDGLIGFNSIVGDLRISNNNSLTNLYGLSGLISVGGDLSVTANTALFEFCGLFPLFNSGGLDGAYSASGNAANPTIAEIVDNIACSTFTGDITLTSQAEVDAFSFTEIIGDLTIQESKSKNIIDLTPLSTLTSVSGDLRVVNNPKVRDLNGLNNITSVGGDLFVLRNAALTDFCGLFPLFDSGGLVGTYTASGNVANPTMTDIIAGGPCMPDLIDFTMDWSNNTANFEVGSIQKISWLTQSIDNIKIEYSTDAGRSWQMIEEGYASEIGYYDWVIPNTPSIYCRIRISDVNNETISEIHPTNELIRVDNTLFEKKWHFTIYGENKWIEVESPTNANLTNIKFLNDLNGIAWNKNLLLETIDGGRNWNVKSEFQSESAYFLNNNFGWRIVNTRNSTDGITSYLYHTINGGKTWENRLSIIDFYWHSYWKTKSVFFLDSLNGWFFIDTYEDDEETFSILQFTQDGGFNSNRIIEDFGGDWTQILDYKYLNLSFAWAIVKERNFRNDYSEYEQSVVISEDKGTTWRQLKTKSTFYDRKMLIDQSITSVFFINELHGWICENIYTPYTGYTEEISKLFYNYKDGDTLSVLYESTNKGPNLVYFYSDKVGWIYGQQTDSSGDSKSFICQSNDSGKTWGLQNFFNSKINDFFSLDGETVWAVGDSGLIMRLGDFNSSPEFWSRKISIKNNENSSDLLFGQANSASNLIDESLNEKELPPTPPAGTFDARFILEDNSSTLLDLRNSDNTEIVWTIQFQPSSGGYPITFSWNKDNLPFGSFFLKDVVTGSIVNVDMKLNDSLVVTNESINKLQIVYKEQFTSSITNNTNWDLISVPLAADNMEVSSIFPDATSSAFMFDGSYKSTENLDNGVGYWLKFADSNKIIVYGDEVNTPISVKKGWNIIGAYNKEISRDKIQTTPTGILTSSIYGFENGYFIADTLKPGNGYWIKTNQDGEISFEESSPLGKKTSINKQNSEPTISFDIIANDGVSDSIRLTFGLDSLATNGFDQFLGEEELPPLPPLGVFDVRIEIPDTLISSYSDYRPLAVDCYEHKISYQLGDSSDGLTLSWNLPEGVTLNISDLFGGSVFNETFESGEGVFSITNTAVNNAQLTLCYSNIIVAQHDKNLIPDKYSLSQNYPNPFNPSTKINFGLPSENKVSLIIYNILGQQVTQLVNQQLKAGYHEFEFNNSNYSSGIYFYRLQAGDYVATKKMILLK